MLKASSVKTEIVATLDFQECTLPVKSLRVPLITTMCKAEDCRPLVDRITRKIQSWTSRFLSYSGRVQLIKAVLFEIQVYWSSVFMLPKKMIDEIEQLMRIFLWRKEVRVKLPLSFKPDMMVGYPSKEDSPILTLLSLLFKQGTITRTRFG